MGIEGFSYLSFFKIQVLGFQDLGSQLLFGHACFMVFGFRGEGCDSDKIRIMVG